jgi:diguanylate cyclase (GGDEF)-like protein
MVDLHLQTALLAGMLSALTLALVAVALAVRDQTDYMLLWAAALGMGMVALGTIALGRLLPFWVPLIVGNALVVGSHLLALASLYRLRGFAVPWAALGAMQLAMVSGFAWASLAVDDPARYLGVRIALISAALAIISAWSFAVMRGELVRPHGNRAMASVALLAYGLGVVFALTRAWFGWDQTGSLFAIDHTTVLLTMLTGTVQLLQGVAMIGLHAGRLLDRLERQAHTDPLTELSNRRHFEAQAKRMIDRSRRNLQPLSLVVIDADHFKGINDELGHEAGDEALRAIGQHLRDHVRPGDLCARLGGEEFAVLFSGAPAAAARERAQALVHGPVRYRASGAGRDTQHLTLSAGLATLHPSDADLTSVLRRADTALYRAKAEGRHRLCIAADPPAVSGDVAPPPQPNAAP